MKVLICGGRNFMRRDLIEHWLRRLQPSTVIHGGATGADSIAGKVAIELGIKVRVYPAKWAEHGKGAGVRRNQLMIDVENTRDEPIDLVVAFPGSGKGTWDMVARAKKAGIPTTIGNDPTEPEPMTERPPKRTGIIKISVEDEVTKPEIPSLLPDKKTGAP